LDSIEEFDLVLEKEGSLSMETLELVLEIEESSIVFFVSMVELDLDSDGRFSIEVFDSILRLLLLLLLSLNELINFDSEENELFC